MTFDLMHFVVFDGSATTRDPAATQAEVIAVQNGTLIEMFMN